MSAYEVSSSDAKAAKITLTFHTPEAAAKEAKLRISLMHTGVKIFEVAVGPLGNAAMTKSHRPAKPQASRPELDFGELSRAVEGVTR